MKLMVVESPNKVASIQGYLGDDWKVVASVGHIRDLPQLEFGISKPDFSLQYEYIPPQKVGDRTFPGAAERVARIKREVAKAEVVYLATDPDREGEAISWHLKEALQLGEGDYERVTFTEITPKAIQASLRAARRIDMDLVHAQEGRRALDRFVGYMVSPLLSDMLGMSLSAGRVQSVAVRLVVELERRIAAFKSTKHFGAVVMFDAGGGAKWSAQWDTKPYVTEDSPYVLDAALAAKASQSRQFVVLEAKTEEKSERPPSPLSTLGMLRAASTVLKMSSAATTKAAQKLFEDGHITYIRTDSVNLSPDAADKVRSFAASQGMALSPDVRRWKEKASAQGGHADAVRPTHIEVEDAGADEAQRALYRLIRLRTLVSQMADARYTVNTVRLRATDRDGFEYVARGRKMIDAGWRALLERDPDDEENSDEDAAKDGQVPRLAVGGDLRAIDGKVLDKKTEPPRRFTEATLLQKLEDEGVGRPATFAAIMTNVLGRSYVELDKKRYLLPTEIGELVVDNLLRGQFGFMELGFTRELEVQLDAIAEGKASYRDVVEPAYTQLNEELARIAVSGEFTPRFKCPKCGTGMRRYAKPGKSPFWRCTADAETCGHYMDDDKGKPVERAAHPCPRCGETLRRFKRKSGGGLVWVCPAEACETFLDDVGGKPVALHTCSKCSAPLRRYQKKDRETGKPTGAFGWFCTDTENCKTFMDDDKGRPVAIKKAPCPKCGKAMYRRKGDHGWWWGCSGYREGCKTIMDDDKGKPVPRAAKGATKSTSSPAKAKAKAKPAAKPKLRR
ncbi:DNA topoisomerase I [Xanthomonas citri pv. fuscans]|uniref:DNA topoisomerase 1 n=1 Tax=Xanthomonas citri pv. fuscans TaxID=366649 RepID=A0AB34QD21_XANCI|nr:DNA topoisomerase [Xanthomonas citri]KGU56249.1 DNA topoisomerase I [Xanthomonas citri pv. fuscans]